jgi:membrane AbrB-like protein
MSAGAALPPRLKALPWLRGLVALGAGVLGGLCFRALGLPLPWTLGAMAAAALLTLAGDSWKLPAPCRDAARPVIGVLAGSAFTPAVVAGMLGWWQALPVLAGFFLLSATAGQLFFRHVCGFDRTTAVFAAMPGGLGEMTLLGSQYGGDTRRLVLVHSVRIVAVVFAVPIIVSGMVPGGLVRGAPTHATSAATPLDWTLLLACAVIGGLVGRRLRAMGGVMILPMLLSAAAHGAGLTALAPPTWLVAAMQVVIGCITGARFAGARWAEVRLAVLQGLAWAALLLVLAGFAAWLTAWVVGMPLPAMFLALSPGGFAEMSIIAFTIGIEVAFVVTCHVFRTLFVLLAAPLLHKAAAP